MIFVLDHLKIFLQNFVHTEYKAQLHASVQFVTSLCVFFFASIPSVGGGAPGRCFPLVWQEFYGAPPGEIRPTLPCNYALSYACFSVALLCNSRRFFSTPRNQPQIPAGSFSEDLRPADHALRVICCGSSFCSLRVSLTSRRNQHLHSIRPCAKIKNGRCGIVDMYQKVIAVKKLTFLPCGHIHSS